MSYDLIIVSQSKGDLIQVTQNCIDSARAENTDLNIIIVETGNPYNYDVDKIIQYNGEFNYNRALNIGLKYAKSDIQILANNDIIFNPGWSVIGDIMKEYNYLSASALSTDPRQQMFKGEDCIFEGYKVGYQLAGWCIFVQKEIWNIIYKLDERFQFWYSDNVYALQLKSKGIKHALITSVKVDHIGSRTLGTIDSLMRKRYTFATGADIRKYRDV